MDEATARYYQALNLEPSASAEQIYQAYRDLVRVWDPQRFANSPRLELMAEEKLNEIIAAYHALEHLHAHGGEGAPEVLVSTGGPSEPAPVGDGRLPVADVHRAPEPPFSTPASPAAQPEVADSDASGAPSARPIADLHRTPEAPFSAAPVLQSAVIEPTARPVPHEPEAQPAFRFAVNLPAELPLETTVTVDGAPAPPAAAAVPPSTGGLVQQAGKSRKVRFAVAGTGVVLVLAAIFFLFEVLSGPSPSRAKGQEGGSVPALPSDLLPAEAPARATDARPRASTARYPEAAPAPRRKRPAALSPEEAPRQVPTGTELMTPEGRTGVGKFRIINQSGEDAVARLASQDAPSVALRLVYIQTGSEVNVGGIGTGVYFVTFSMGRLTSKPRTFGRQFGPFQFMQIQSAGGYESDQYQILLKPRK